MGSLTADTRHDRVCRTIKEVAEANNFRIFTTFRLDVSNDVDNTKARLCTQHQPIPFSLHRERLIASALAFGWEHVADRLSGNAGMEMLVDNIISGLPSQISAEKLSKPFKVRLTVSRECDIGVDYAEMQLVHQGSGLRLPKNLSVHSMDQPTCKIVLDREFTKPSPLTTHKTSARSHYDGARERAAISNMPADANEVLLLNDRAEVMEASISTPYFFREDRWVTPPLSSGGNSGVTRRVALERGLCAEEIVRVNSLRPGETVWISNGVRGFMMGTLDLHE